MNKISGRIVVRENGVGIPDLLVVIYDLDPGSKPEETLDAGTSAAPPPEELAGGDRLAGVLTRLDGSFSVDLEDPEFQIRNRDERRPDLALQVLAPEEPGLHLKDRVLYASTSIRQNAGRIEEYLIRLSIDQLIKAGLSIPSPVDDDDDQPASGPVHRLRAARERSAKITDGMLQVARERVQEHRDLFQKPAASFNVALRATLSTIPPNTLQPERLVLQGESPAAKCNSIIKQNIREVLNSNDASIRAPSRGFITLTDTQVDQLRARASSDGSVSASELAIPGTSPVSTLQRTALLPLCRPHTTSTEECANLLNDPTAGNPLVPIDDPTGATTGTTSMRKEDIPPFVRRLVNPLTAPEELLLTGLMPTATLSTVQMSVRDLALHPSPADVPAFHDFNQLQIAFEHVWQELTDKGLIDLAGQTYETIVELGGDPNSAEYSGSTPVDAMKQEGQLTLRAIRRTPPPVVRDHRNGGSDSDTAPGGVVVSSGEVRDHRSPPDPAVRLPALLTALEERMREKYSFTVYAANAQERSVNFGILNTYRQVWTPLTYQAGPLIKSIPLAPKQMQKVVVTRKVSKKRHQKELETNLRVIKDETSQTNRAEQEIARRASAKTEFSYSNTASADMGVGSDTSTTTFKQEASRSSDDIKKSFRESIFKSAQEFKHERVTEVTTDFAEENETTETTEISNPNDAIGVTYLFYELQRRYRLHERLHRVTPVVLVAQEVPAPNDIDLDWLIAHDWILKREILDDSFLPTIESLCQSSGADTSLQQLGANVSQQRKIVATLESELAVFRRASTAEPGSLLERILAAHPESNMTSEEAADKARDLTYRLEREVTALNSITETYAKALRDHHTHLTEIARLRVHVKANILHYMHGIWRHEHPDQRFFRLHNVPVPTVKPQAPRIHIDFDNPIAIAAARPHEELPRFGGREAKIYPKETFCRFPDQLEYKPLCQVAAIDQWLGCKGNYMIFPLLESNPITDFMMAPYLDHATGDLLDPSDPYGYSLDEFAQYVCCLKRELDSDEFAKLRPVLKQRLQELLTASQREDDILIVPTNSLFIEALPSEHELIERFKKEHRMIDVKRAQAEVRRIELENIRYAARILAEERDDPEVEQRILVQGEIPDVVVPAPQP